jgi:2-dehydro-3-deoxygalactonokinase
MAGCNALTEPDLVGLDWGTSSCRAYLLGREGVILADARAPSGLMAVNAGHPGDPAAFDHVFEELCGGWLNLWPDLPAIACGMAGSRQGWVEAPYRVLPADLADPALACARVRSRRGTEVHVIPGLADPQGLRGVMRGEETQLLGANLGEGDHEVVLPGTHSKWARLQGNVVTAFTTFMTGELYALLARHSILATLMRPAPQPRWAAFDRGVDVAAEAVAGTGLLGVLFSARTLPLTGAMDETDIADYLSGLVIGTELASARRSWVLGPADQLCSVADPELSARYARAAMRLGWHAVHAVENAAARGLWRTAHAIGLVDAPLRKTSPGSHDHGAHP